jgi:CubicO group peptidase (beta-lactamase class C family)
MGLPSGWLERMAAAPRIVAPGTRFQYDDGAAHLFGAALATLVGTSLSEYAAAELFEPLGVQEWHWPRDPDGLDYGFGHLRLSAADLGALGRLWTDHGVWEGERLVDPEFAARMVSPHSAGGWPEERPYGYFIWIDEPVRRRLGRAARHGRAGRPGGHRHHRRPPRRSRATADPRPATRLAARPPNGHRATRTRSSRSWIVCGVLATQTIQDRIRSGGQSLPGRPGMQVSIHRRAT